jgi:hypothetical protein
MPIEMAFDKWQRFENFLKFAERKELKDRLKELEPPPMSNYVDPGTIDAITRERKNPANLVKKKKSVADFPPDK